MLQNPWNGSHPMGANIFGFNVNLDAILPSALAAAKQAAITGVVQSSDVQQAITQGAQQATVQTLAQKIASITPKQIAIAGGALFLGVGTLVYMARKRK